MWAANRWVFTVIKHPIQKMAQAMRYQGDRSHPIGSRRAWPSYNCSVFSAAQTGNAESLNSEVSPTIKVCWKTLARVGRNCWLWWMNAALNNGAAASFKSATATAAGPNSCGRGERQLNALTGRVNLQTKSNKRYNGRNKASCLGNLTDRIIFPNVLLLLSCRRRRPSSLHHPCLVRNRYLALKCSQLLHTCPNGRGGHSAMLSQSKWTSVNLCDLSRSLRGRLSSRVSRFPLCNPWTSTSCWGFQVKTRLVIWQLTLRNASEWQQVVQTRALVSYQLPELFVFWGQTAAPKRVVAFRVAHCSSH